MEGPADSRTAAIRRFNRFYTRRIGVLHEKLAATRFSLTESRLLWELSQRGRTTATELARLNTIFPNGVCDFSKPGVNQTSVVPNGSFGPSVVNLVFDVTK